MFQELYVPLPDLDLAEHFLVSGMAFYVQQGSWKERELYTTDVIYLVQVCLVQKLSVA